VRPFASHLPGLPCHVPAFLVHFLDMFGRIRHDPRPELLIQILERCLTRCDAGLDVGELRLHDTLRERAFGILVDK